MELFSLLAKLTLDKSEYDKAISDAEKEARNIDIDTPDLDLTKEGFDATIAEAEMESVKAPHSPDLDMTKNAFDETVGEAQDEEVKAPDSPDLGLEKEAFEDTVAEAEGEEVNAPISPDLGLTKEGFDETVTEAEGEPVNGPLPPDLGLTKNAFDDTVYQAENEYVSAPDEPDLDMTKAGFDATVDEAEDTDVRDPDSPHLDLEKKEFDDKIAEAESQSEGFGDTVKDIFENVKGALVATGVVGAIAGIVKSIKEAVDLTAQTADGIDKGSRRLGISTKAYQEWDHALRQSGAGISDLGRGVRNMQAIIKAADPGAILKDAEDAMDGIADGGEGISQDVAQAFADLGLTSKIANKELHTTEDLMNATLMALADFKGTKEQRGVLVRALFGNNADGLNALLDSGKEGVESLLSEASDLGLIMSDDEITNAVAYGDAVANLQEELNQIKIAFVQDIIPVLTDAVGWLTDFLTKLNPRLQTNSIYQIFNDIDKKTVKASLQVDSATASAKKLIEDLQDMGDYWSLDEQGRMTWDALASKALELFPELSKYIDTDGKKINGNTLAIEENIDAWARLEKQRLLSAAMDEKAQAVAEQLTKAYEKGADAAVLQAEAEGKKEAAYKAVDRFLNSKAGAGYKMNLSSWYGYTGQMTDDIWSQVGNSIEAWMNEYGSFDDKKILEAWTKAEEEAEKLRKESEKMITEAEEAQSKLSDYETKLAEQMGLTKSEIVKTQEEIDLLRQKVESIPTDVYTTVHVSTEEDGTPKAIGDAYVPYDNFPALLHRGERVLTATEARNYGNESPDYSDLEDRIVSAIRAGMADAQVLAVVTDSQVAKGSNRYNGNEIDAGRFRP